MNTHSRLALRRQSIRTLTADELRMAHGGRPDGGNTGTKTADTGSTASTRPPRTTGTRQPTLTSTDLPQRTATVA